MDGSLLRWSGDAEHAADERLVKTIFMSVIEFISKR